jgi:hypothetical protein
VTISDDALAARVAKAVRHYWTTRTTQARRQGSASARRDAGLRSAVTGGAQLDGFLSLVRDLLIESGLRKPDVCLGRNATILPGFYRPTKAWDRVAVAEGKLVACIEVKSQAGPSYGNNFNNRVEEAIGNAVDFWKAYEEGGFPSLERPFLGYLMLLEDDPASNAPVAVAEPHFKVRDEFRDASYARRYELFCEKLMRERLYDATAFLMSGGDAGRRGSYREPSPELTFKRFAAALMGRGFAFARGR